MPDITFPPVFDPEEVGESTLDNALPWDEIHAVSHRHFYNIKATLDELHKRHQARTADDPDFVFYRNEYALSQTQKQDNLIPLNLKEREAKREAVEQQYLALENQRRQAKGLELLATLDDLEEEQDDDAEADADTAADDDDTSYHDDPFAIEAANILLDSVELNQRLVAVTR